MCRYYAHTHSCGHTTTIFAAYCASGALVQRPCHGGEIWQTLKMDHVCSACQTDSAKAKGKAGLATAGRR
ncbi:uncharacterized protein K452DRAFT_284099 [Aplosporella prunicola CBS 121167]|uniref:Uncharacterized protein n=1 Tax=Aplosporella prunicola CBS 121167 TaxID=1176127 RepID=A0A6A6BNK7_9PEZI|nr:uncharacterized protein K452DRAFT_284099 [Aplosporella prunicola CBS 121167]KAF2145729.1 hypothetical protein K452DRAFT_284099 [Aplosporella prunicola CBS 121167]